MGSKVTEQRVQEWRRGQLNTMMHLFPRQGRWIVRWYIDGDGGGFSPNLYNYPHRAHNRRLTNCNIRKTSHTPKSGWIDNLADNFTILAEIVAKDCCAGRSTKYWLNIFFVAAKNRRPLQWLFLKKINAQFFYIYLCVLIITSAFAPLPLFSYSFSILRIFFSLPP